MAENRCDYCGKYEMLPFNCKFCGGTYCTNHRLPEYHNCPGLRMVREGTWKPPVQARRAPAETKKRARLPKVRLPAQGLYAYGIIGICILTFILQVTLPELTGAFILNADDVLSKPWTVITYMFLHAGILHIFFNMLMLFFFGPLLERQIGSLRFLALFLASGILAGLAQALIFGGNVLGASAAIFGVMGTLAALMPNLRIFLYFVPMKIIYAVLLFAFLDLIMIRSGDQIAHLAHLVGLAIGLAYGYLLRKSKGTLHAYWPV